MLYRFIRPFATLALQVYFRKIYIANRNLFPKDKPVILAVNHPTAFLEPCILACFLPRPLHFLTRGDIFKNKFIARILYSLNLIPIYRLKDGFQSLKKNQDTFQACYEALKKKKTIMILVEGSTKQVRRLRPLQKGAARIALGAMEHDPKIDVHIVPVGMNYSAPNEFRSKVYIALGQPIIVGEYLEDYQENPKAAIRDLTHEIGAHLRQKIIHIENEADDLLVDNLLQIYRNRKRAFFWPSVKDDTDRLAAEIEIAEQINLMEDEEKEEWKEELDKYESLLQKHGVRDLGIAQQSCFSFGNTLVLLLGFIPFIVGLIANYLPIGIAKWLVKNKVNKLEYKSSILVSSGMLFHMIYSTVLVILALFFFGIWGFLFWLMLLLAGYFSVIYIDLFEKWNKARKFKALPKDIQDALDKLREHLMI